MNGESDSLHTVDSSLAPVSPTQRFLPRGGHYSTRLSNTWQIMGHFCRVIGNLFMVRENQRRE